MVEASLAALIHPLQDTEYSNESELLAACRRREIRAFEQVYRTHGGRLKSIAYHILGNRAGRGGRGAGDVPQAVPRDRSVSGAVQYRDVAVPDSRSTRAMTPRASASGRPIRGGGKATGPKNQLPLRVALDDALGRIHPRHRMVFLLFEVEGLKHSEIAAVLEVPEGTSKAWLFEAKKELKRMLTERRR